MDVAQLIYYSILILFLLSFISFSSRKNLKYLAIWFLIFLSVFIGYSYRDIVMNSRLVANLFPAYGITEGRSATYIISEDNHFYVRLKINNVGIVFLVDTGATDITLNKKDAKKIGVDLDSLRYDKIFHTANGQVRGAAIMVQEVSMKGMKFQNVPISINQGDLDVSLLGMRFLNLFERYEFSGDKLTLYW